MAAAVTELAGVIQDPVRFSRGILGLDPWLKQAEILQSVVSNSRTAVKACHSSGKTRIAAAATIWWVTRWPDGKVITTAPTWNQVEMMLWAEIRDAIPKARIDYPDSLTTQFKLGEQNFAIGLSTNEGIKFQGFHGGHILVILDEAPGVLPGIWEAIEGARAGGDVRVLALGNPVIASGAFYDAFGRDRASWNTLTISAFDTPNLQGLTLEDLLTMPDVELDSNPRPYLTTRRWVKEKYLSWGEKHPSYQSRVLGNFPSQAPDALFDLTWLEQAKVRETRDQSGAPLDAGVDVAGPGDDETVLVIRQGSHIVHFQVFPESDPRGAVLAALHPFQPQLRRVRVDSIGIGYNFGLHIQDHGYPVDLVNVGEASSDPEQFANLKAELYWSLRDRVRSGEISGLEDDETIAQLAGIRYKHTPRGLVQIESKEDARKRGVRSPDRAEGLMLAFTHSTGPRMYVYEV